MYRKSSAPTSIVLRAQKVSCAQCTQKVPSAHKKPNSRNSYPSLSIESADFYTLFLHLFYRMIKMICFFLYKKKLNARVQINRTESIARFFVK